MPWTIDDDAPLDICDDNGLLIGCAFDHEDNGGSQDGPSEIARTVARKFAASEDLLDALRVAVDKLVYANRCSGLNFSDVIFACRAAIAKAERMTEGA